MEQYSFNMVKKQKHIRLIIIGIVIILLIIGLTNTIRQYLLQTPQNNKVIGRVGEELLYTSDFDYEMQYTDTPHNIQKEKYVIDKMVTDSMILQEAQKKGLIKTTKREFNSAKKDYKARLALLKSIEKKYNSSAELIEGYVITVWFANNDYIGPLGYEKSKEFAYNKISEIHNRVSRKVTRPEQAIALLQNDPELEQLDLAWKTNTGFHFIATNKDQPTFDKSFNEMLWNLSENKVSEIVTLQEANNNKKEMRDVLYAFGIVTRRQINGQSLPYDEWVNNLKDKYNVTIYKK